MLNARPLRLLFWPLVIPALAILAAVIASNATVRLAILLGMIGIAAGVVILRKPYIGIAAVLASLVVVGAIPRLPFVSSITVVLGGLTLIGYFLQRNQRSFAQGRKAFNPGLLLLMMLVLWIFFSNPSAALFSKDRTWLSTLLQLWVLAWLGGELIDTPSKNRWVFIFFIVVCDISAIVSIKNGVIGTTIAESLRSGGLTAANTAARYYVLALLFSYYIFATRTKHTKGIGLFLIGSILILILGLANTLSRSGFVLLPVLFGLILFQPGGQKRSKWLYLLFGIGIILVFVPDSVFNIVESKVIPSIVEGSDTVGIRYRIWEAGLKMFLDHPIRGVGIGQFQYHLRMYAGGSLPFFYLDLTTHSIYIQVLSETGLTGTLIFLAAIFYAVKSSLKKADSAQGGAASTGWIWLSVLVIILVGGITKSDFADKFLWIALGITFQAGGENTSRQGSNHQV